MAETRLSVLASPFLRFLLDYKKFWRRADAAYHTLFTLDSLVSANIVGWSAFLFVIAPFGFSTGEGASLASQTL